MMKNQSPDRGRCSLGVILLDAVTFLLVLLDIPFALTAPMNIGMTEGAANGPVLWAEVLGGLMMVYPLLAIPCIIWSELMARANLSKESLLFAILPYFMVVPMVVIVIGTWE